MVKYVKTRMVLPAQVALKKATRSEKALELLNGLMFDVYFLHSKFIKAEISLSVISYTVFYFTDKSAL